MEDIPTAFSTTVSALIASFVTTRRRSERSTIAADTSLSAKASKLLQPGKRTDMHGLLFVDEVLLSKARQKQSLRSSLGKGDAAATISFEVALFKNVRCSCNKRDNNAGCRPAKMGHRLAPDRVKLLSYPRFCPRWKKCENR